jgi:hypothetical protein
VIYFKFIDVGTNKESVLVKAVIFYIYFAGTPHKNHRPNGDRFFIGTNVNKSKINHKKSLAN